MKLRLKLLKMPIATLWRFTQACTALALTSGGSPSSLTPCADRRHGLKGIGYRVQGIGLSRRRFRLT